MEANPREILIYETEDGRAPFSEWMESIDGQPINAIVMKRLDKVERGSFGDHKGVGVGVIELRIDFGPGYRVYLGQDGKDLVILLIGGDKSSQPEDVKTAKKYWSIYNA